MELSNRLTLEATLAGKLSRLYGSHRRKIAAALKANPDPKKVPASLWREIESETEQQLAEEILLVYLLILAAESDNLGLGLRKETRQSMGAVYATARAKEMAAKMTEHSRERIEAGSEPLSVFGPERAATVARSEVGVAQAAGSIDAVRGELGEEDRQAAFEEAEEDQEAEDEPKRGKSRLPKDDGDKGKKKRKRPLLVAYWRHSHLRPKGHAGAAEKPCPICTPRLNKPESQWGGLIPGQAHPHCDCYVEFVAKGEVEPSEN